MSIQESSTESFEFDLGSYLDIWFGSANTGAAQSIHSVNPQQLADTRVDGDTPAQVQERKRKAHRRVTTHLGTQAGPHKCEWVNPRGEVCNKQFSRSYDLTRHEHTIHNKQRFRCELCTDKTLSRADALTRHYRVCHPGSEVPQAGLRHLEYDVEPDSVQSASRPTTAKPSSTVAPISSAK
ncbi:hypothetical protein F5144DRAFT_574155 [Chaetomium tenue]|uniref:Uncharacterized protein n=1 Tax=Chaetomium tenue TaxID=1854479 RepID=A0ACB7PAI8_9PEZI|nr:hypothetical protein F5144DRAFT_574155 [Chaetomium globosum]